MTLCRTSLLFICCWVIICQPTRIHSQQENRAKPGDNALSLEYARSEENYFLAQRALRTLLDQNPDPGLQEQTLWELARFEYLAGHYLQACHPLRLLLVRFANSPNKHQHLLLIAISSLEAQKLDRASHYFYQLLLSNPPDEYAELATAGLAEVMVGQGRYGEAERQYALISDRAHSDLRCWVFMRRQELALQAGLAERAQELAGLIQQFCLDESEDERKTANPDVTPKPVPSSGPRYFVQIGAYSREKNAIHRAQSMQSKGYNIRVLEGDQKGKKLFRVQIGPYPSLQDANAVARHLAEEENILSFVERENDL